MITNSLHFHREGSTRYISVSSSPYLPTITTQFEINTIGVKGID